MRVAHIITRLILGGAQENTLLTCEDLQRDFHDDVLLITGPALGPEGTLLDRARANQVPLAVLDCLRRAIHPTRDLVSYRRLKQVLRDFAPDVVHTHSAKAGFLGRAAASALRVPAIVHTVHGAPFHPYQNAVSRAFFRSCERWASKRCDALICVADAMTDLLVESRVAPREQFHTVYSGMEVEPFLAADDQRERVRRELQYRDDHVVIVKVARLFHLKGHDDVIRAAAQLAPRHPQVRFLFVGDGVLRPQLERQVAEAGLTNVVRFHGLVPPEKIPELLAASDILVHASLREGLPRAVAQGVLAGKPVVCYDVDGAREIAIRGVTGSLIPPQDVAGLVAALEELATNPALRAELGGRGRQRFANTFRHQNATAEIRGIYERLLSSHRESTNS